MGVPTIDAIADPRQAAQSFLQDQAVKFGLPANVIAGIAAGPGVAPSTLTRTTHAFTLRTSRGRIIGAAYGFVVNERRMVEDEYEIEVNAHGEPADIVPQTLDGREIRLDKYDLYTEILEDIFGSTELVQLTDQARGWRLRECWVSPAGFQIPGALNTGRRYYEYRGFYLESKGREIRADNERISRVNASGKYFRRQRVS